MKNAPIALCAAVFLAGCATENASRPTPAPQPVEPAKSAADWARQGHRLSEQGQLQQALVATERALELDPTLVPARFDRGQMRLTLGDHKGALADLDEVVAQSPDNPRYLGARCIARVAAGQVEPGMADCEKALTRPDQRANALVARGQARLLVNRNADALNDFKAALNESPNHMRALYGQGVARQKLGDPAGGADRDEALRRLPGAAREFLPAMMG
jgi:tetratricopeptide (TPR) repeat protein